MKLTPCAEPENNPEDWFIRADGKQYPDEEYLTEAERRAVAQSVIPKYDEFVYQHEERVERAIRAAEADRRRRALQLRRQAREKCFECPVRTQCLDLAITVGAGYGTWGGYFEEDIKTLRDKIAARKRL